MSVNESCSKSRLSILICVDKLFGRDARLAHRAAKSADSELFVKGHNAHARRAGEQHGYPSGGPIQNRETRKPLWHLCRRCAAIRASDGYLECRKNRAGTVLGGEFLQIDLGCFLEVLYSFFNGMALAGYADFRTPPDKSSCAEEIRRTPRLGTYPRQHPKGAVAHQSEQSHQTCVAGALVHTSTRSSSPGIGFGLEQPTRRLRDIRTSGGVGFLLPTSITAEPPGSSPR